MTPLERSLALSPAGEGVWSARSDASYEANPGSMFGGWTAALLLNAVTRDARAQGAPASLNVHYLSRIPPETPLRIEAAPLGGGRSLTTWRADVRLDSAELAATASVVMAQRRESEGFTERAAPETAPPDAVEEFNPPGESGRSIDVRPLKNHPPFGCGDSYSLSWIRDKTGHPLDPALLSYFADSYAPRIFFRANGPRPSSTITLAVYFYADAADLATAGHGYVLSECVGTRASGSLCGSQLNLWSAGGALLATSEQLCWVR